MEMGRKLYIVDGRESERERKTDGLSACVSVLAVRFRGTASRPRGFRRTFFSYEDEQVSFEDAFTTSLLRPVAQAWLFKYH